MCGSASTFAKVALAVLLLALILQVVAVATDYWMTAETTINLVETSIGLWNYKSCPQNQECTSGTVPDSYGNDSFTATQVLECIVLVVMLVLIVAIFAYVTMEKFRNITVAVFICIICFVTACLAIIAMVIWLSQIPTNHYASFSLGLAVLAFVLVFLAGILMIPDIRNISEKRRQRSKPMKVSPQTDYSYNRRFTPTTEKFRDSSVRHYHNPNREPYMAKSPPPSYRKMPRDSYGEKHSIGSGLRTEVLTPDVYLGRNGGQRY